MSLIGNKVSGEKEKCRMTFGNGSTTNVYILMLRMFTVTIALINIPTEAKNIT
jgi:hypothetical protein